MYSARIAQTSTLLILSLASLAAASPAPIDPQQANVIAANRNAACSGPQGCLGANGTVSQTVDTETTSGASRSVAVSSGALLAAVVLSAGIL